MRRIDLNCDLGEGAGHDRELMPLVTSVNIACGAHAGNLETMIETVELAVQHGVRIGAHPGYFDLENFGRTERAISSAEAGRVVLMQIEQLYEVAGSRLRHVKLHGALYNQVARDRSLADGVVAELARLWPDLVVYAPVGSALAQSVAARGMRVAAEAFVDRRYQPDGTLLPRGKDGAVIVDDDAAVAQGMAIARDGQVTTADGSTLRLEPQTICIHGDRPNAVALASKLRRELAAAGIEVRPVGR